MKDSLGQLCLFFVRRLSSVGGSKCIETIKEEFFGTSSFVFCSDCHTVSLLGRVHCRRFHCMCVQKCLLWKSACKIVRDLIMSNVPQLTIHTVLVVRSWWMTVLDRNVPISQLPCLLTHCNACHMSHTLQHVSHMLLPCEKCVMSVYGHPSWL